ncbi:DUF2946 family protein [Roseibium sediminicola]|uniref:DUF2946 family protein n=1 Tax=Roseibium sediminicola TaxID=2933272 RepID=A0ABT0H1L6_9HYPH|nr:DUF2946 family protein [Roseibium sp. CAU 1639]MCK7615587.1 hypothetical protein [Roseibium sp. CAU 1639]
MRYFRQNYPEMRQAVIGLLLPFLLVALLPQGYMPAVTDGGTFTVTLCTSEGLRTVTLDANGQEVPDGPAGDENGSAGLCVFAGIGQFAAFHAAPHLPTPLSTGQEANGLVPDSLRSAIYTGALGARAPPVLL